MLCVALLAVALVPLHAHAALTKQDLETLAIQTMSADDPRAALLVAETWRQEGLLAADKKQTLRALRLSVLAHIGLNDSVKLDKDANAGLTLARELKDKEAECELMAAAAVAKSASGGFAASLPDFDAAISLAEQAGYVRCATSTMIAKAFVYDLLGRSSDALTLLFKAHQRSVDIGDKFAIRQANSVIGNIYGSERARPDELKKALAFHLKAFPADDEPPSRHEAATNYFNLAVVYQRLEDWKNAHLYLEKSAAAHRALKDETGLAFVNFRMGMVAGQMGRWHEALPLLNEALPPLTRADEVTMIFNVQGSRALALAHLDRRRESLEALANADTLRARIDSPAIELTYLRDAGAVYERLGDFEQAYRHQSRLVAAEKRSADIAREEAATEAQARFEVKQAETENALLRARANESRARNVALSLALVVLLIVLGGLTLFLRRQSRRTRRFADLAHWDDLTRLPNRRGILKYAAAQLEKSRAENTPLWLALIDIDHFKALNDKYGHAAGDAVLAAFAQTCVEQLRRTAKIGRYGGEEFLLIMPGAGLDQAAHVFARLRAANAASVLREYPFTFSMGAISAGTSTDDLDRLIQRADEALYRAKSAGRDRLELAR